MIGDMISNAIKSKRQVNYKPKTKQKRVISEGEWNIKPNFQLVLPYINQLTVRR